ncbi:MAG: hypothetical protein HY010_15905 [Acidobacteria bacterium]|nr:hypothetical protein [Acidobacteriota bacterium]
MPSWFFVTDLHGASSRYETLLSRVISEHPAAVFIGGDLLPRAFSLGGSLAAQHGDFIGEYLVPEFSRAREKLGSLYPSVFLILGNDDPRIEEGVIEQAAQRGLWQHIHDRKSVQDRFDIYGYAMVPPTPFLLKDWERYDVSRYVPPGCVSPEEGLRSLPCSESAVKWGTIQKDLANLTGEVSLDRAIFLFHTPPYETPLDRAALDGRMFEHVPIDVHVGSIAVQRFIGERQPLLTLHGHVHESTRLTGKWKIKMGRTVCINGAHDGPELALVRFDPESPEDATRELL